MKKQKLVINIFSVLYDAFFKKLGHEVSVGKTKKIMDPIYVIFEKIACQFPFIESLYIIPYRSMIKQELSMISLSDDAHVLIIGCGSLPATALALNEACNVKIDCVDIDAKAVENAKRVLSKMKNKTISVQLKNVLDHPLKSYDLIYLLYGILDQIEMLKYISDQIDQNTIVLFRTSTDINETKPELYTTIQSYFTVKNKVQIDSFGSIQTYYLSLAKNSVGS